MDRLRKPTDDQGVAMVVVMGAMVTLMVVVLGVLAYVMKSEKFSRYDQDYTAAMAAAQAGVDDYISRLNKDATYSATVDCANTALQGPTTSANACGWNTSTAPGWQPVVAGDATTSGPRYHYSVDSKKAFNEGTIIVTSTGRSKDVHRTIEVAIGKGGSTDFVYYTDFEAGDPASKTYYPNGAPNAACGRDGLASARYYWQTPTRTSCTEIQFASLDVLDGRVFSNDSIWSVGGTFLQGVESANPGCQSVTATKSTWTRCLRAGTATFGKQPKYSPALYLDDNSAAFASYPGCHYRGATRIIFNKNGTMTVWSKDSTDASALSVTSPEGVTPSCGTVASLTSTAGATVPVPSGMVVYVGAAPSTVERRELYAREIGGPSTQLSLPLGSYSSAAPTKNATFTRDLNMTLPTKYRGEGNLYVEGILKGQLTLATAQSIVASGDLVLADGQNGSDVLGLVATNSVEVMHPRMVTVASELKNGTYQWKTTGTSENEAGSGLYTSEATWPRRYIDPVVGTPFPVTGLQIAGSIQTLQHSFFVQYHGAGNAKGTLRVSGSIAQRWRGAVATGSNTTGYAKNYTYDQRLQFSAPPYFPHWVDANWSLRYSGEINTPKGIKD